MDRESMQFRDRAVFLPSADALVLGDMHLGRSRTAPIETPLDGAVDHAARVLALVTHFDAGRVIVAGDVLDAFDVIPPGVTDRFVGLRNRLVERDVEFTLLQGNHDPMLSSLIEGDLEESVTLDETVVCHGHRPPEVSGLRYVIGHEHPAIRIEGVKRPCYLLGSDVYDGSDVLVLPAFSRLIRGTVINHLDGEDCHSPIVRATDLDVYRPIVVEDDSMSTLTFPPLGSLRPHL